MKTDLHFHSNISDGKLGLLDLAKLLQRERVGVCSLTDHDTVKGLAEFHSLVESRYIKFIPGVELSVQYDTQEIHILAYDFDVSEMQTMLDIRTTLVQEQRRHELIQVSHLFRENGLLVSTNIDISNNKPIGLLVAADVYSNLENREKLITMFGSVPSPDDFYHKFQAPGRPCYAPRSGVVLEWVLDNIRPMARAVILAHPFVPVSLAAPQLTREQVCEIVDRGLTGVEVYHSQTNQEDITWLEQLVQRRGLMCTGGSDFHGNEGDVSLGTYGHNREVTTSFFD